MAEKPPMTAIVFPVAPLRQRVPRSSAGSVTGRELPKLRVEARAVRAKPFGVKRRKPSVQPAILSDATTPPIGTAPTPPNRAMIHPSGQFRPWRSSPASVSHVRLEAKAVQARNGLAVVGCVLFLELSPVQHLRLAFCRSVVEKLYRRHADAGLSHEIEKLLPAVLAGNDLWDFGLDGRSVPTAHGRTSERKVSFQLTADCTVQTISESEIARSSRLAKSLTFHTPCSNSAGPAITASLNPRFSA